MASTGLKKAMSTSYSLDSDLPLNLSVSSARSTEASLTSAQYYFMHKMRLIVRKNFDTMRLR